MSSDGNLRPEFHRRLPTVDWQAVETSMTGAGVPDSNFCVDGSEGWIEHKRSVGWAVKFRPEQPGWILRRIKHGGRVFVAVRRRLEAGPRRGPAVDQLWFFWGGCVVALKVRGLEPALNGDYGDEFVGMWDGGPGRWRWDLVLKVLRGESSW